MSRGTPDEPKWELIDSLKNVLENLRNDPVLFKAMIGSEIGVHQNPEAFSHESLRDFGHACQLIEQVYLNELKKKEILTQTGGYNVQSNLNNPEQQTQLLQERRGAIVGQLEAINDQLETPSPELEPAMAQSRQAIPTGLSELDMWNTKFSRKIVNFSVPSTTGGSGGTLRYVCTVPECSAARSGQIFYLSKLKDHHKTHFGHMILCLLCQKKFPHERSYRRHHGKKHGGKAISFEIGELKMRDNFWDLMPDNNPDPASQNTQNSMEVDLPSPMTASWEDLVHNYVRPDSD